MRGAYITAGAHLWELSSGFLLPSSSSSPLSVLPPREQGLGLCVVFREPAWLLSALLHLASELRPQEEALG